jgi:hypothetical protein
MASVELLDRLRMSYRCASAAASGSFNKIASTTLASIGSALISNPASQARIRSWPIATAS